MQVDFCIPGSILHLGLSKLPIKCDQKAYINAEDIEEKCRIGMIFLERIRCGQRGSFHTCGHGERRLHGPATTLSSKILCEFPRSCCWVVVATAPPHALRPSAAPEAETCGAAHGPCMLYTASDKLAPKGDKLAGEALRGC